MDIKQFVSQKGCLTLQLGIAWDSPEKPSQFKFPRLVSVVTCINPATGEVSEFASETGSHEKIQDIMVEAYGELVHPALREFVARPMFDQFNKITGSDVYQDALRAFKAYQRLSIQQAQSTDES